MARPTDRQMTDMYQIITLWNWNLSRNISAFKEDDIIKNINENNDISYVTNTLAIKKIKSTDHIKTGSPMYTC